LLAEVLVVAEEDLALLIGRAPASTGGVDGAVRVDGATLKLGGPASPLAQLIAPSEELAIELTAVGIGGADGSLIVLTGNWERLGGLLVELSLRREDRGVVDFALNVNRRD